MSTKIISKKAYILFRNVSQYIIITVAEAVYLVCTTLHDALP